MDHYNTLGVARNATPDEIKKAYRKLASQHHPDKGGDTTKFQQIQKAYDILSNPNKKQEYDNPPQQHFNFNGHQNLGDIFNMFGFGDVFKQHTQQTQLLRTRIEVSLLDAYNGSTKTLRLQTNNQTQVVNINIPKGIQSGQQIRYEQLVQNSVLIVEFVVSPDLKFERNNDDLYTNQSISVLDLIIGTKFDFTTISGKTVEVNVKPMTQPFMQLKLIGCGMPIINSNSYGDQIILIKPFIPANIHDNIVNTIKQYSSQ